MKLLQSEIDVVPGRRPQKQPLPEGYVGTGLGTLRIDNTTQRQNSYTIHIKCEQPFWQDAWCTLSALPPAGGAENAPPTGKPDQPGPRGQSLTIFIKDGGVRDVLLSFFVPEKSECRAGVYKATVIVETRVVSDDPHAARKERITELPISIIVRPFHKWQVSFSPEEKRVGLFRRRTEFELAVDNQGNDWLYVDLKLPRPQNVLIDAKVQRLAVPPPDGDRGSVRTAPVGAITRQRVIRGPQTPTPLPLTVQRVDAPSIPPLPEEAAFGPSGANLGAAVVAMDTNDVGVPSVPSKVVYCPPIPDTLTGFLEALVRNVKGLVVAVIGAIIAWQLALFVWEFYVKRISEVTVQVATVSIGQPFKIRGKNLIGSHILLFDSDSASGGKPIGQPVTPKPDPQNPNDDVFVTLSDKTLEGKKVIIGAQRLGALTVLNSLLPVVKDPNPVQIGEPIAQAITPTGSVPDTISMGDELDIGGQGFGTATGRVLLNAKDADVSTATWSDKQITIPSKVISKTLSSLQPGDKFTVEAFTAKGTQIQISPNTVSIRVPQAATTTGGTTSGTTTATTGGTTATSGGASSGGTSTTGTTTGGSTTGTSGGSTTGTSGSSTTGSTSSIDSIVDWDSGPNFHEMSDAELRKLDSLTLRLMRNDPYARRGLKFKTPEVKSYFEQQPWYKGTKDAVTLSGKELDYVNRIKKAQGG